MDAARAGRGSRRRDGIESHEGAPLPTIPRAAPARRPALVVSYVIPCAARCPASAVRLKIPMEALDQGPSRTASGRRVASFSDAQRYPDPGHGLASIGFDLGRTDARRGFRSRLHPGTLQRPAPARRARRAVPLLVSVRLRRERGPYVAPVRDMLAFRYRVGAGLRAVRTPTDAAKVANDVVGRSPGTGARDAAAAQGPDRRLLGGVAGRAFGMDVVVQVRHPAAFVSSLKRYGWTHPFGDFLAQPLLMRDLLGPFEDEIRDFAATPRPPFDQAILLWRLIHHAHRRVPRPPSRLALLPPRGPGERPGERLPRHVRAAGPHVRREGPGRRRAARPIPPTRRRRASDRSLRRDSRASIWTWKSRLTEEEIERVRVETEPLWKEFYSDGDW